MSRIAATLVLILLPAAALAQQLICDGGTCEPDSQRRSFELREQANAAKGGRERLRSVQSILVLSAKGRYHAELLVFPSKYWRWTDYRPSPLGLSVEMYNLESGKGYLTYPDDPASPRRIGAERRGVGFMEWSAQLLYFMETEWVKPVPLRAEEERLGGKPVDTVYVKAGEEEFHLSRVAFALDRTTHLPIVLRTYRWIDRMVLRNGRMVPSGEKVEAVSIYWLKDYHEVNGIMLPGKISVEDNHSWEEWEYQVNPDYDERLFQQPPAIEDGPEAWKKVK